jgi:DNA-binding transcriptional LysR family regulator
VDRLLAMSVFAKVVELGGFARAAERLGLSTSATSRCVAELEAHLETRLLNRTTRRLSLTESGQVFYERCVQLLADLDEAEQATRGGGTEPRGTLRLTCAISFGRRHLAPAIADFLSVHPRLRFEVALSDRVVDLVEEGYDLAIRIGDLGSRNLVARKLADMRLIPCASPAYLARCGWPQTPADLAQHTCFTYEYASPRNLWRFRARDGREVSVRIAGNVHANNGDFLAAAAVSGVGVAFEPDFIVGEDLKAGRLVRLLDGYESPAEGIYAVYPSRRHLSAKVRAFVDFLAARFGGRRDGVDL